MDSTKAGKVGAEIVDITPICPHCDQEIRKLLVVPLDEYNVNRVFCCPHCRKIIGTAASD